MRPGTRRRISLNAEAWTLCRASLCRSGRHGACAAAARFPDRSLDSGSFNPADAGTECRLGLCSLNMVVKLQPEIHNHVCLAPRRRADLVVTRNFVKRGASELQLRRAFLHRPRRGGCNHPSRPPDPGAIGQVRPPAHAIAHRLSGAQLLARPSVRRPSAVSSASLAAVRLIFCGAIGGALRSASAILAASILPSRSSR